MTVTLSTHGYRVYLPLQRVGLWFQQLRDELSDVVHLSTQATISPSGAHLCLLAPPVVCYSRTFVNTLQLLLVMLEKRYLSRILSLDPPAPQVCCVLCPILIESALYANLSRECDVHTNATSCWDLRESTARKAKPVQYHQWSD